MLLNIYDAQNSPLQERKIQPKLLIALKVRKPCYRYITCSLQFIVSICFSSAFFYSWREKSHELRFTELFLQWKPAWIATYIYSEKRMRTRYIISHAYKYLSFNFYCYFKTHSFSFSLLYSFPVWIIYEANILSHFRKFVDFRKEG